MRTLLLACIVAAAPVLSGQERSFAPDSARASQLRAEVERRFAARVQRQLELTNDQASKLRATQQRFAPRRRALWERQRSLREALASQMRPGIAAEPDSVVKLMDQLRVGRTQLLALEEEEDRDMAGYLSPVQRAQFQLLRERFLRRVQELRRDRTGPRRQRRQR